MLVPPADKPMATNSLSDFLAEIVVPRDLKTEEARKLGAFLLTISVDFKPDHT
jgi:hypothetical protein